MLYIQVLLVCTGAGYHSASNSEAYKELVNKACLQGILLLSKKTKATEVAARVTAILEDSHLTNAGIGSNLTLDGGIEGDASIMEGNSLLYGAVGALPDTKNPILVAFRLLETQRNGLLSLGRIPPNTLAGTGARQWAKENGLEEYLCDSKSLITEQTQRIYNKYKQKLRKHDEPSCKKPRVETADCQKDSGLPSVITSTATCRDEDSLQDTVGAVCVDDTGCVAAAASSGGIVLKHSGRLGQAALYGCGCWAENNEEAGVAVCTSGSGEHITKTMLAKEMAAALKSNDDLTRTVNHTITDKFLKSPMLHGVTEKYGGILGIKSDMHKWELEVEVLWAHSTKTMCLAYMSTNAKKPTTLMSKLPEDKPAGTTFVIGSQQIYIKK